MEGLLKVIFPFLSTTKNYDQVLRKLASFAFYEGYILTLMLRSVPRIDTFFTRMEVWGPIGKVLSLIPHHTGYNISGIVIGFAIAILTHMFQFHDRISDMVGIRRQFDRKNFLIPMAAHVGIRITPEKDKRLREQRDRLMQAVFYRYASSRDEAPLVDKHYIEHALNAWSWLWVFVEGAAYWSTAAIIAWWFGDARLALWLAFVAIIAVIIGIFQRLRLPGFARPQVEAILRDQKAANEVERVFRAL